MAEARAICPRCGEPVTVDRETRLRRGDPALCDRCYLDSFELIDAPDRIELTYCTQCGAVKRGKRWVDVDADDRIDLAVDAVQESLGVHVDAEHVTWRVVPEQVDETTVDVECRVSGAVRETPIEASTVVPVKLSGGTCQRCGRMAGGYHGGIVQVRAADRDPTDDECDRAREIAWEVATDAADDGDREAFVTDIAPVDGGLDMKLSTPQLGRQIASRIQEALGGALSESETLVTEDGDGNEVYRVTFALRLPAYRPGDLIDPEDGNGPVQVLSVHDRLTGRRLTTGAEYTSDPTLDAQRLGHVSDAIETTLVTVEDDNAVQILDPETYEPRTIARPSDVTFDDDTVWAVATTAGLFVLPAAHV